MEIAPTHGTLNESFSVKNGLCQVLDVACGTGVVGKEIREAGYTLVDGLDPSRAYLEGAMDRGIFRCLENSHQVLSGQTGGCSATSSIQTNLPPSPTTAMMRSSIVQDSFRSIYNEALNRCPKMDLIQQ